MTNETVFEYFRMLTPKYGFGIVLGMLYFLFYEVLGVFFEVISLAAIVMAAVSGYLNASQYLLLLAIMILSYTMGSLVSLFIFDKGKHFFSTKNAIMFIFLSFAEFFLYRPIIYPAKIFGTIDFLRRDKSWHRFDRIQKDPAHSH